LKPVKSAPFFAGATQPATTVVAVFEKVGFTGALGAVRTVNGVKLAGALSPLALLQRMLIE
jgi:hypothetical protein